jgi:ABC-type phosphate transport system permease subunit
MGGMIAMVLALLMVPVFFVTVQRALASPSFMQVLIYAGLDLCRS